ncbi:MAG: dUTP diphosphatase [Butyrivibrio sp.]|uniref:dUTP diphosphatase n=1 Tax=Butyrivibrio sp. TaxID=28121 RepID=UPI001B5E21B0|nr:dUTP diphosphatase [Butyrivibrio sp.]MBP3783885.1 dUTP diphosphatase [Butyrivibrio sp.]
MQVEIKKLSEDAQLPTRGSEKAAGYDLRMSQSTTIELNKENTDILMGILKIKPHETVKVGTGLAAKIPDGYFGAIYARSGLATKQGLRPANAVGVIDSDYRGELIVALHNDTDKEQTIKTGDRIAQLVVMPYLPVEFTEVDTLDETERGAGGFGSTGAN